MEKELISGVPETMLQTLYARAKATKGSGAVLQDPIAAEMVSQLSYDFSAADQDKAMYLGVVARTILLDQMTESWLKSHPGATVLNIACGLDTRCYRMEGLYGRWYNLDLPETMAIREKFLQETGKIQGISCSVLDPAWLPQVEDPNGPVLVILEGLTMYLQEEEVKQIFCLLDQKFASLRVFAEVMNPHIVRHFKEKSIQGSGAKFTWGISGGRELETLLPPFHSLEDHSLTEGMQVFLPIYKILGKIPLIRNISNKILVLEK